VGSKTKTVIVVLIFLVQLALNVHALAEPAAARDQASLQEVFLSVPLPTKDRLTLVSFFPIIVQGAILGGLAAYDDATTKRSADYLELFNDMGTVLAIGWFDSFGIERIAVDRALLNDADTLEGVLVLLVEGDFV
jgi:hypothetical protein